MTAAAKSVYFFGFYLYVLGVTLIFLPNLLLTTMGFPPTDELWIRVAGLLVVLIGFYYHQAGAKNISAFIPLTIPARTTVFIAFIAFVLLKMASPILILMGAIDLAGAIWTFMALKKK
jgi:hypothetical protein